MVERCENAIESRITALEVQLKALDRLTEAHQRSALMAVELAETRSSGALAALRWMVGTLLALMVGVGALLVNLMMRIPR